MTDAPAPDHSGSGPTVLIATPLDAELVDRVAGAVPDAHVIFEPSLLPPPRYTNDHAGDPSFVRTAGEQQAFDTLLDQAEVLFGVPGETAESLRATVERSPKLRWVQGTSAGFGEQIQSARLSEADLGRVVFTSSVGVHATQLAEWAMLGLLYFAKGVPRLRQDAAARRWPHYPVAEVSGKRLVVVGLGHVGRETARLARGLGMHVTGVRRHPDRSDLEHVDACAAIEELDVLLAESDAVVLSLPGTRHTEGLLDATLIRTIRTGAILVNVGRGSTVDERALVEALRSGQLLGAALDVVSNEPLSADSPLWVLDNVLLSPHTAALSERENERIVQLFIDNLQRYAAGASLRNVVDLEEFY